MQYKNQLSYYGWPNKNTLKQFTLNGTNPAVLSRIFVVLYFNQAQHTAPNRLGLNLPLEVCIVLMKRTQKAPLGVHQTECWSWRPPCVIH